MFNLRKGIQSQCVKNALIVVGVVSVCLLPESNATETELPIADAHIHYSHDSVQMTTPERVIELMRQANLKLALVSSSDDQGTQLLSALAPDIIVPGLRPYTQRGQLNSWFTNELNLQYVEELLKKYRYASIGEFHLYGDDAELPIPRRIVQLASTHNLILHAHSDAYAIERLLAQDPKVKVIWAHAGFDEPEDVSQMLSKHDRLWVDLAFRGEVGSGGSLSAEWQELFSKHPTRVMLGTDTYTPERMYYIPEHAASARVWLNTLPREIAEAIAWKNAHDLIMPIWEENRRAPNNQANPTQACQALINKGGVVINDNPRVVMLLESEIVINQPFSVMLSACDANLDNATLKLDATMPQHGHGMNYLPIHTVIHQDQQQIQTRVDGIRLHMPGSWQWAIEYRYNGVREEVTAAFTVN